MAISKLTTPIKAPAPVAAPAAPEPVRIPTDAAQRELLYRFAGQALVGLLASGKTKFKMGGREISVDELAYSLGERMLKRGTPG